MIELLIKGKQYFTKNLKNMDFKKRRKLWKNMSKAVTDIYRGVMKIKISLTACDWPLG